MQASHLNMYMPFVQLAILSVRVTPQATTRSIHDGVSLK